MYLCICFKLIYEAQYFQQKILNIYKDKHFSTILQMFYTEKKTKPPLSQHQRGTGSCLFELLLI